MGKNNKILLLAASSVLLYLISRFVFPLAIFVAISPLIALANYDHKLKYRYFDFSVLLVLLIDSLLLFIFEGTSLLFAPVWALCLWLAFVAYDFTRSSLKNNIGTFTLIIFWLAAEYCLVELSPGNASFLLGTVFDNTGLAPWSGYSGILGISCWILFANILMHYVFFKGSNNLLTGNVRWLSLSYSVALIALPIIVASFASFEISPISAKTVEDLYNGAPVDVLPYRKNGEFFGRTAAWVSILLVTYAFVKRKIK